MSESEYRDAREAARARVEVLEAELRDHDASSTPRRDPPRSNFTDEKKELRYRLGQIAKSRTVVRVIIALLFLGFARQSLVHEGSASGGLIPFVAFVAVLLMILFRKSKPRGEELVLERRLRKIIQTEDDEYARFRVETSTSDERISAEKRERIEAELDEARALAESAERK